MAVNVAEFISVLRKIRDVIYPEVNTLYTNAVNLNETINTNKADFETNLEQFNQDYEVFNQDIVEVNDLVVSAQASASSASQSAQTATIKSNEIKAVTTQSTTLSPGSQATASYNPVDGKITIGVPSGLKGDKGDSFTVNAVGITSERSTYDTQPTGFSFLDITLALIYFKLSSASGNWSTGSPFGKGEKGDPGAAGNGISGIVFLSTTHSSGFSGQSGGIDTYRITYTNGNTFDYLVHNGLDSFKPSSTDNAIARFDGTTGNIQNSNVVIDDSGNVGIGEPNPASKLHVKGNVRTSCSSGDAINTRGIIFDIDGTIHGRLSVDNIDTLNYYGTGIKSDKFLNTETSSTIVIDGTPVLNTDTKGYLIKGTSSTPSNDLQYDKPAMYIEVNSNTNVTANSNWGNAKKTGGLFIEAKSWSGFNGELNSAYFRTYTNQYTAGAENTLVGMSAIAQTNTGTGNNSADVWGANIIASQTSGNAPQDVVGIEVDVLHVSPSTASSNYTGVWCQADGASQYSNNAFMATQSGQSLGWRHVMKAYCNALTSMIEVKNGLNEAGANGINIGITYGAENTNILNAYVGVDTNPSFKVTGDATHPVWIKINGTLKKVIEGAPNSGGAGYKQLIVVN